MTPKEKAEELFDRMHKEIYNKDMYNDLYRAKQCAIVAVDEIIQGYEFDSLEINHKRIIDSINFWDEVKKEIEKV
jgi:hypothetical protein